MTKKSETRILEEDLEIDLKPVQGEQGDKCSSLDELDVFEGNNTQDPNSIFNPSGNQNQGYVDGNVIEKSIEKNRFIGTLIQSSRTEMKYNHKTEEILHTGNRSVVFNDLENVKVGDKIRIIDDRGFGVLRYIDDINEDLNRVTFKNVIESIESQYEDSNQTSDHISKGADVYFIRRQIPWIDRDENIRSSALLKLINRSVQTFVGEVGTTEKNNGFEIESVKESPKFDSNLQDNFVISKGTRQNDNRLQEAGRYYINGIPAMIPEDVLFLPKNDIQFQKSKEIMPKTSNTKQLDSVEGKIVDKNASFPVDNTGNGMLTGKTIFLGFPDEQNYEIIDNNKTEIFVNTDGRANVDEVTTSGQTYYRIKPEPPEGNERNDSVFLNMYFDVVDQYDDPSIYAMNEGERKTHSQNRLKIKQRIELREGDEPDLKYNGTDQEGLQHMVTKIGELNRQGNFITENQKIDKRNVFRSLGKIGMQNILMNPSFEFTDTNTQNNETTFIDWFLLNPNNTQVSVEEYKNQSFDTNTGSDNLEQSARLNIEEEFNDTLFFTQVYEDVELNSAIFEDRNITFSINAKPLSKSDVNIQPYIKVETNDSTTIRQGELHSGEENWQRLSTFNRIDTDKDIQRVEIGLKIEGNQSDPVSILFDQGALVYGIFPSGINFFNNQLLNQVSILKDEIQDARRSTQRSTNYGSVDARLDGYDQEVIEARGSSNVGNFPSVKERNNDLESRLDYDHDAQEKLNTGDEIMHPFFATYNKKSSFIPAFDTGFRKSNMNTTIKFDHNSRLGIDDIRDQDLTTDDDGNVILDSPYNLHKEFINSRDNSCAFLSPWGVKLDIMAVLASEPEGVAGGLLGGNHDPKEDKLIVNDLYLEDDFGYRWIDTKFSKKNNASASFEDKVGQTLAAADTLQMLVGGFVGAGLGILSLGAVTALSVLGGSTAGQTSASLIDFSSEGEETKFHWPESNNVSGNRDKFKDIQCIGSSHPSSPSTKFNRYYDFKTSNGSGVELHTNINLKDETDIAKYRVIISFVHFKTINLFGK